MTDTALLNSYIHELNKVMPPDFKDWWDNSREEQPVVARMVIENLRTRERIAWKQLARLSAVLRQKGNGFDLDKATLTTLGDAVANVADNATLSYPLRELLHGAAHVLHLAAQTPDVPPPMDPPTIPDILKDLRAMALSGNARALLDMLEHQLQEKDLHENGPLKDTRSE